MIFQAAPAVTGNEATCVNALAASEPVLLVIVPPSGVTPIIRFASCADSSFFSSTR